MNNRPQLTAVGEVGIPAWTRFRALLLVLQILALAPQKSSAQLAITEVMSSATNRFGTNIVPAGPDFWELTNFGDDPIDLTGYSFNDSNGNPTPPFTNVVIAAGGVIVFVEDRGGDSAVAFREWWGLSSNVFVVPYLNHGLSKDGDDLRLWSSTAATDDVLVHSISFPKAVPGFTFLYNPASDTFDAVSSTNLDGTFGAATSDDMGSPGTAPAPVPLAITAHPTNSVANEGDTVTFSVSKRGLPPPSYQWFFNDAPIPGARFGSLILTNVQLQHKGRYRVVLSNRFGVVQSTNAELKVNLIPTPPRWLDASGDLIVFENQSPTFRVMATGVPQPTYQWYFNGVAIQGAQQNNYTIESAQIGASGAYSVVASNTNGAVTNVAQLVVTTRPDLRITEVMTSRTTDSRVLGREDWWELTSFETNRSVDLFGYRFDDGNNGTGPHLESSWTNREHVIIGPSNSVIFVKSLSSDAFRTWWGHANLPVNLQIITFPGDGRGLNIVDDVIFLWNPGATEDGDENVFKANWFTTTLTPGVSFTFDLAHPEIECCDELSVAGVNGAVAAARGGDIGSPGYLRAPEEPRILSIRNDAQGCCLEWRALTGRSYTLEWRTHLTTGNWITLTNGLRSEGASMNYLDATEVGAGQRFYRVMLEP